MTSSKSFGEKPLKLSVAVIGGGVAGAYSAWRLKKAYGSGQEIGLFEYSNRIGGRLFSTQLPGMKKVMVELGGMRYIPNIPGKTREEQPQPLVNDLINTLNLPTQVFPMGSVKRDKDGKPERDKDGNIIYDASGNYYYLRGKHLTLKELSEKGKVPYKLNWQEDGKTPEDLQKDLMNLYTPGLNKMSGEDLFKVRVFGEPFYKMGYWNFLQRVLGSEGFSYMRDAGGYDANVANASAVAQLPVSDFGPETQFRTLTNGYQSLPETLEAQFRADGGQTFMNKRLESIERNADGTYVLTFARTKTVNYRTSDLTSDSEPTYFYVHADKVVLAMPRRSLELIKWDQFEKNEFLKNNIQSVLIQQAFKLAMGYDYPWWRSLGLEAGRSITDMPIRQVYYFGAENDKEPEDTAYSRDNKAVLLASYNDISTVPFWRGLMNDYESDSSIVEERKDPSSGDYNTHATNPGKQPYKRPDKPNGKELDPTAPAEYTATNDMIEAAQKQVKEMHGLTDLDMPFAAIFHDWGGNPYGGGWHEWKAGYRYDLIIKKMIKPVEAENVFIVGEAYSNNQGWVEGSLETSEDMMKRFFNLEFLPTANDAKPASLHSR